MKQKKHLSAITYMSGAVVLFLITISCFISITNKPINSDNDIFIDKNNFHALSSSDTSPDTSSDAPQQPDIPVKTSSAKITVTGDIMFHDSILDSCYDKESNTYNFDSIFDKVKSYSESADYAIANLETTIYGSGKKYSGFPLANSPESALDSIKSAGFDMLLTANNHAYDTRADGMMNTIKAIDKKNIEHVGTVLDEKDKKYLVKNINGINVGMMCYTFETTLKGSDTKLINGLPVTSEAKNLICSFTYNDLSSFYKEIEEHISQMRSDGAEVLVLFIHWGNEYKTKASSSQTKMAQKLCDLGIDVIVGGHPHMIQPLQLFTAKNDPSHKTVCIYSTGNALSNQRAKTFKIKSGHTEDGMLFSLNLDKYSDGHILIESVEILPTWVNMKEVNKKRSYQIIPLDTSIDDWKTAFNLDDTSLSEAKASLSRTNEIVGEGLKEVNEYFSSVVYP